MLLNPLDAGRLPGHTGWMEPLVAQPCSEEDLSVLSSSASVRSVWLSQARICSLSWPSAGGGSLWRGGVNENEIGWRIIGTASSPLPTSTTGSSPIPRANVTPHSTLLIGPHGTPAALNMRNQSFAFLGPT